MRCSSIASSALYGMCSFLSRWANGAPARSDIARIALWTTVNYHQHTGGPGVLIPTGRKTVVF